MRLAAHRGSFYPLPNYGSRLYALGRLKRTERAAAARQYVAEALAEEKNVRITSFEYTPLGPDSAEIKLGLSLYGGEEETVYLKV